MPIWIEALIGLAAIALCAVACWREDALVAWEDKHLIPWAKQLKKHLKRSCRQWISK